MDKNDLPEDIYDMIEITKALKNHENSTKILQLIYKDVEKVITRNNANYFFGHPEVLYFYCMMLEKIIFNSTGFKYSFFGFNKVDNYMSLITLIISNLLNEVIEPFIQDFIKENDRFYKLTKLKSSIENIPTDIDEIISIDYQFYKFDKENKNNTLVSLFLDWISKSCSNKRDKPLSAKEIAIQNNIEVIEVFSYQDMVDLILFNDRTSAEQTKAIASERELNNLQYLYLDFSEKELNKFKILANEGRFNNLSLQKIFSVLSILITNLYQWRSLSEYPHSFTEGSMIRYRKRIEKNINNLLFEDSIIEGKDTDMMWERSPFGDLQSDFFDYKLNKQPHSKKIETLSKKHKISLEAGAFKDSEIKGFKEFYTDNDSDADNKIKKFWIELPRLQVACLLVYKEITNSKFDVYNYIYNTNEKVSTYNDASYISLINERMNSYYLGRLSAYV